MVLRSFQGAITSTGTLAPFIFYLVFGLDFWVRFTGWPWVYLKSRKYAADGHHDQIKIIADIGVCHW